MHASVQSSFSCVRLFVTLWTVAHQAPLSMGFPRQEYWRGLPFPPPGDLPHTGIKPTSPALSGGFFCISFFTLLVNNTRGPRWVQTSPCYQSPTVPRLHSPHSFEHIPGHSTAGRPGAWNVWTGRCPGLLPSTPITLPKDLKAPSKGDLTF